MKEADLPPEDVVYGDPLAADLKWASKHPDIKWVADIKVDGAEMTLVERAVITHGQLSGNILSDIATIEVVIRTAVAEAVAKERERIKVGVESFADGSGYVPSLQDLLKVVYPAGIGPDTIPVWRDLTPKSRKDN